MDRFRIDKILFRRGADCIQKRFNESLHKYVSEYEETSRQQESQQNQPKAIENKELLQQIENA